MIQTAQEPLSNTPHIVPTRTRFGVIVFAVTLAVVTYIDRVCISQAAPFIRQDLGLNEVQMGLASFSMDLAVPPSWAVCMDVGGRACGTLSGGMNMMGNLAGSLGPLATGFLLVRTGHNWDVVLYTFAAAYFMGTFCWLFLDPVTPLIPATPVRGFQAVAVRDTGN